MRLYQYKISEEELVIRLKNNDKTAFSILYDSYYTSLYGVVKKVVKTDPPASDVLQDVFLKIWKNIGSFDEHKGKLFTWLLNISRNSAIDRVRSGEYQKSSNSFDIENHKESSQNDLHATTSIDGIGLQKVLDQLKPDHQLVIDLAYFQGYSQSEIADKLQIPLGTVKTKVKLAMTHLREILKTEI